MRRLRACLILMSVAACCLARIGGIAHTGGIAFAAAPGASDNSNNALPQPIVWRQLAFSIPFKVADTGAADAPAEVRLYVSKNSGGNWEFAQKVGSRERSFMFRAPGDGEYWFQIRTADKQGRITPEVGGPPELRVIVDTIPPQFELTATRGDGGDIKARWRAVDPLLNADSLKIEYQNSASQWRAVAIDRPPSGIDRSTSTGTLTWFPNDAPAGVAMVRAEIGDRAGNVAVAQARAEAFRPTDNPASSGSRLENTAQSSPANPPRLSLGADTSPATGPAIQWPSSNSTPPFGSAIQPPNQNSIQPPFGTTAQSNANAVPWPGEQSAIPWPAGRSTDVPFGRRPIPSNDNSPGNPSDSNQSRFAAQPADRLAANPGWETVNPAIRSQVFPRDNNSTSPLNSGDNQRPSATTAFANDPSSMISPTGNSINSAGRGTQTATLPPGARALMVNSRTFDMDYEVDAVGPSGIAKVELWGTQDSGRTWRSYGIDADNRSPIRAKVEGEGLYGFRVVVQSGNRLGGLPPVSGDRPDIWVVVDLTKPSVQLIDTKIGEAQDAGTLFIRWQATDNALAVRPITLQFSEKPGGPWATIAAGLDNTGQYAWRPDNRVPDRIFLRIEARDEAGNVGSFEATQPVALERFRPGGRIQGVRSIDESAGGPQSVHDLANGARIYRFNR